jgi:diguanylate cyclase (GGDEF)-like protein
MCARTDASETAGAVAALVAVDWLSAQPAVTDEARRTVTNGFKAVARFPRMRLNATLIREGPAGQCAPCERPPSLSAILALMTWEPDERISSLADDLIQRRRRVCSDKFREQDLAIARRHGSSGTLFMPQVFAELRTSLRSAVSELANGMTADLLEIAKTPDGSVAPDVTAWITERVDPIIAADAWTLISNMSGGPLHREQLKIDLAREAKSVLDDARRDVKIALGRATLRPRRRASDVVELASIDELVKLKNRRGFNEDFARLFAQATVAGSPLALVRIDVDHFKRVNDEHGGHAIGDEALVAIARILEACVRGKGEAYRVGGDEFTVLLPNHTTPEAAAVSERMRGSVRGKPITTRSLTVSVSVGVAVYPEHAMAAAALERAADAAAYDAKNRGRNLVRVSSPTAAGSRTGAP